MKLCGARILIECLREQGVDTVFGIPGASVIGIYDELYKAKDIKHVLCAHEQGAAFAADGYARSSGKTGVCIATSGPGATNLITGIASAYMDSVPVVAITGNSPLSLLGKDSFQEVDITGATMPVTKHNYIVKDVSKLAGTIREAFEIASGPRPGPVLIDIPKDIAEAECEYSFNNQKRKSTSDDFFPSDIRKTAELICSAKRPLILAGGGTAISSANKEVMFLAETIDAPVADTLMGKGTCPSFSPRYAGMLGMYGDACANEALSKCDLLIVLGSRFSDRSLSGSAGFAKNARIIQIDIDYAEIDKNVQTDEYILGDIKTVLNKLCSLISTPQEHPAWMQWIKNARKKTMPDEKSHQLSAYKVISAINSVCEDRNTIFTTEVGQHQMWASKYLNLNRPRQLLTSGGLGAMGYGLGAAIGAQIACPDAVVINLAGDGSFRMNMGELSVINERDLPIIEVIFNNGTLGMVHQWQRKLCEGRYSATELPNNIDYMLMAAAFSLDGYRITQPDSAEFIFRTAVQNRRPALIECVIGSDDPADSSI